jgi:hypothetical protein
MIFVYVVRCNFTDPAKEAAWNAWYSGPKIADMLRKPHFLSCQRFVRDAGKGRDYLALWTLASPDAFNTAEYTADWGFFEWQEHVVDWSRDLFDGGDLQSQSFAVPGDGSIEVLSFDGMTTGDAGAANEAIARSGADMMWLPVVCLDRHTPMIGLRTLQSGDDTSMTGATDSAVVQRARYRPICEFQTATQA